MDSAEIRRPIVGLGSEDVIGRSMPSGAPFLIASSIVGFAVVVFALWIGTNIGGTALSTRVDEVGELIAAAIAGAVCIGSPKRKDTATRRAWLFLGISAALWAAGEAAYTGYALNGSGTVPFPSLADIGFLAAVPFCLIGILSFPAAPSNALSRVRILLDALILGGSLLFVSWATTLGAVVHSSLNNWSSRSVAFAYPVSDIVIATLALSILSRVSSRRRLSLGLIVAGLICLTIADSSEAFFAMTQHDPIGSVTDAGWFAGYLLIALAGLSPEPSNPVVPGYRYRASLPTVFPYFCLGLAVTVGIWRAVSSGGRIDTGIVVCGFALAAVVTVRHVVTLFENVRLNRNLEQAVEALSSEKAHLSYLATHDRLTGIGNRGKFEADLESALGTRVELENSVAVLFCDLDQFKDVNDALGHSAGDQMLGKVAQRLDQFTSETNSIARIGGDEFAIVVNGSFTKDEIVVLARKVIETVLRPMTISAKELVAHLSIGITIPPQSSLSVEEVLLEADIALYASKDGGGDQFTFYDTTMGDAHIDRLQLQADLLRGIREEQFFLVYQPILEIRSGTPVGVEALLRWRHPRRGVLAPEVFLGIAERTGAIIPIGKWVLEQALGQLHGWRERASGAARLFVSVNLSVRQLSSDEILVAAQDAMMRHQIGPGMLRLELTESALIDRSHDSLELLDAIRKLGIGLDLDDFGTGYSTLSYLKRLPIDTLKVDRSLVEGLGTNPSDAIIVETVISLAQALDLGVVAEGIETQEQLQVLQELNCEHGQGYLWSHPLEPDELEKWLDQTRVDLDHNLI